MSRLCIVEDGGERDADHQARIERYGVHRVPITTATPNRASSSSLLPPPRLPTLTLTMPPTDPLTSFRLLTPLTLYAASPALAALHATRARLQLHPAPAADVLRRTHCAACGAYLLDGMGSVRVVRMPQRNQKAKKRGGGKPYARVLRRACGVCGGVEDMPVQEEGAGKDERAHSGVSAASTPIPTSSRSPSVAAAPPKSQLPSPAIPSRQTSLTPSAPSSVPPSKSSTPRTLSPAPSTVPPQASAQAPRASAHSQTAHGAKRAKKKAGLQDLLARNRARQAQESTAAGSAGGGLAAFLQGL